MPDKDAIESIVLELARLRNEVNDLEEAVRLIKQDIKTEAEAKPEAQPMLGFKNFTSNQD